MTMTTEYNRQYYKKNAEHINEQKRMRRKKWRDEHKEELNAKRRLYRKASNPDTVPIIKYRKDGLSAKQQQRQTFLFMYGNACQCCGETCERFLCLDHINGQAGKKREHSGTAYSKAIASYQPDLYRILCWNCNSAVRYGRTCPHKETIVLDFSI